MATWDRLIQSEQSTAQHFSAYLRPYSHKGPATDADFEKKCSVPTYVRQQQNPLIYVAAETGTRMLLSPAILIMTLVPNLASKPELKVAVPRAIFMRL